MKTLPIRFTGGLDRSVALANSGPASLSHLKGWKPNPLNPRELVTCRGFAPGRLPYQQGSFWSDYTPSPVGTPKGSKNEAIDGPIVAIFPDGTTIKDDTVWEPATPTRVPPFNQMQVYVQELFNAPTPATIWSQCFIAIENVTAAAIPLGARLAIHNDSATTFEWFLVSPTDVNGPVTGGLPCTVTGTPIMGGAVVVYFMTASGFPFGVNSTQWSWRRTDRSNDDSLSMVLTHPDQFNTAQRGRALYWTVFKDDFYYIANTARLMKVIRAAQKNGYGNPAYVISAGYNPIYGLDVESFYGHIVVVAAGPNSVAARTSKVIAWSDNIEPNTFFPTDTNEADTYTLPQSVGLAPRKALAWKDTLFIFTSGKSYYTNYLGLPNVFSFAPFVDVNVGGYAVQLSAPNGLFTGDISIARGSPAGVYFLCSNQVMLFNGATFTKISDPLTGVGVLFDQIFYSLLFLELTLITYDKRMFVYQELTSTWHEEFCTFATTKGWPICFTDVTFTNVFNYPPVRAMGRYFGSLERIGNLDTTPRGVVKDDLIVTGGYGKPTLRTQMLSGGMFGLVKEAAGGYFIGILPKDTKVITPRWYVCEDGELNLANVASNVNSILNALSRDGTLSFPRVAFRGLVLEIELSDTDPTKFPGKSDAVPQEIRLVGLELEVTGTWPQQTGSNTPSQ